MALQLCATCLLVCLSWSLICFIGYSFTAAFTLYTEHLSLAETVSLLLAPLAHLLILAACFSASYRALPKALITFCLVTNTEMIKDRKAIEEVAREQKAERCERNFRVFQAMRLIRREYIKMIYPDPSSEAAGSDLDEFMGRQSKQSCDSLRVTEICHKRLKDITVKHIIDNFKKIGRPRMYSRSSSSEDSRRNSLRFSTTEQANWAVNIEDIHRLIKMCGGDLNKFESFYLLKRSNYGAS